ncbi:MAG TPA: methyltransferase domain-containing protein [Tepidisphaeraceae bacterium]
MTDTRAVWDRIAGFWDDHLKEGNDFQRLLIMPATDRLLDESLGDMRGRRVLDACCGNGNYARRLASRGAKVTAFDGSGVFIERARQRTPATLAIGYHVTDATDEAALLGLATGGPFDAIVCSMALMDLSDIGPLLRAGRQLLAPGGVFVWSVCHPCFNATSTRMTAELVTASDGRIAQRFGVATETYLTPREEPSEGILNQPEPHPMFHRPLGLLLRDCFAAGYVVDALEEPAFPAGTAARSAFSWAKRPEIPPALVVRLRA